MSTEQPAKTRSPRKSRLAGLNYRETRAVIKVALEGKSRYQALREIGVKHSLAEHPSYWWTPAMDAAVEQLAGEMRVIAIERGLVDATEILEVLSDAIRFDRRSVLKADGTPLPPAEWPDIAGALMEGYEVEEFTEAQRSHDGETKNKEGGWDAGAPIRKTRLKFGALSKYIELAMKHKAVAAMMDQKGGDVHVHLHAEINAKLQGARERERKIIEAAAQEIDE